MQLRCTDESSPDACDTFEIFAERRGEGTYRGLVTLKKALNYEVRNSYNLIVEAVDAGEDRILSSTSSIYVQVEDVQDQNPVFLNAPYSKTVPEGTPEGTEIFSIQVRDGDTGIPRPIELTIEGDRLAYFKLQRLEESSNGVIVAGLTTTSNIINREHPEIQKEGGLYAFKIRAREIIGPDNYGEETTTSVTIVVTDVDDELPLFNRNSFTVPVPEDVGSDTPLPGLTLEVVDKDVSRNAEFTLTLEPLTANTAGVFSVYPERAIGKTPVIIRVKDPQRLDYENEETRSFEFNVVAETNNGFKVKSNIKVIVQDSNDNVPVFEEGGYEFSVAEDAKAGDVIGTIVAVDPDSGSYGEILYSIKGFGSEKFYVQAETGEIMVAACGRSLEEGGKSCLDWETEQTFSLTYTASDGGDQTTTSNLLIRIEDKNDNYPKFDRDEYNRVVREGDAKFQPELFIRATDRDGPMQGGGKVFYAINSINTDATVFEIDPMSGEILMIKPVRMDDTENGRYDLVIRATDMGKPPLHSDIKVYVNMGSIRNQKPKFVQPRYDIAIRENAEPGSEVSRVQASDPDGTDSGLTYFIHSGSKDNFKIEPKTGIIRVAPDAILDIEQNGEEYRMEVRVIDSGEPHQQTSQTMVTITVQDVNNKLPVFDQELYTAYVLENEAPGHQVLLVTATDQDRNAELEYDIIEPIIARDKSGTELENVSGFNFKAAFSIDPRNGQISINEKLSYSSAAVIILTLEVRDKNAEDGVEQVANAEATLYIQAFNADNPVFPPPWTPSDPTMVFNITENRAPGSVLFNLGAKDPITGQQVSNYLKQRSEDAISDIIQISQYGEVISNQLLDYEQIKSIYFSVAAVVGPAGEERVSEAHITLLLVDVNDNAPVFEQSEYSIDVSEDALPLTSLLTVHATDADTEDFGTVVYSMEGEGVQEFMINPVTGLIQIRPQAGSGRSGLDREWKPTYNLRVLAKDMPGGGSDQKASSVVVKVKLKDVNDSPPNFSESSYRAVVPENSQPGTLVAHISATDPDLDINNNNVVQYDFANPTQIKGLYRINRQTGEIFTNDILTGKGRKEPYLISVRALDRGTPQQFRDTDLYVTVGDVSRNDGVPQFMKPEPGQVAEVPEESSTGTAVFQAEAVDPDDPSTANGKLVYSFPDDGSIVRKFFQIDSNSGLITTRVPLDREEREEYTLILEARDLGNPVQETTRLLTVRVRDVDDHPPHFVRQRNSVPLSMQVEEEMEIGSKIGEVVAVDEDTGKNAIIDYAIIYGNDDDIFAINRDDENKAIISLNKRLDREVSGLHTLTIKCFPLSRGRSLRQPYNKLKMDEVQVKVHVVDKDDNNPTFVERNITRGVRVNAPIYTELGKIQAEDPDAEAQPIVYSLENVTFHRPKTMLHKQLGVSGFLVDPRFVSMKKFDQISSNFLYYSTGVIQTNQSYGKYADGYFEVKLKASNSPDPSKADYTFLKIFVLQDTDLMKFVFDKNPVQVRALLP